MMPKIFAVFFKLPASPPPIIQTTKTAIFLKIYTFITSPTLQHLWRWHLKKKIIIIWGKNSRKFKKKTCTIYKWNEHFLKVQIRFNLLLGHSIVNINLFTEWHPFNWPFCQFIPKYISLKLCLLAKNTTESMKAAETAYDVCIVNSIESPEQYLSVKCAKR